MLIIKKYLLDKIQIYASTCPTHSYYERGWEISPSQEFCQARIVFIGKETE